MTSPLLPLPERGSTDWYGYEQAIDDVVRNMDASRVPLAAPGFDSTNVKDGLLEVRGLAFDGGDIWASTAKPIPSGTLSPDSDLNMPIAANETTWLDYYLEFTGATAGTANLLATLTVPAGATGNWSSALDYNAAGASGTAKGPLADLTTSRTFKLSSGVVIGIAIRGKVINGNTAGTIVLSLAQNTEDLANPLTRLEGASLTFKKYTKAV